jgi:hypothetical protein
VRWDIEKSYALCSKFASLIEEYVGHRYCVIHGALRKLWYSLRCTPETTVVLVASSLLYCYILCGGRFEELLEILVGRLHFVSGKMAELQYKRDLPRLRLKSWHFVLNKFVLLQLDTRPVYY